MPLRVLDFDGAHGALFGAIAAFHAGVFVYHLRGGAYDIEHALRAGVNADAASRAFVSINVGDCHSSFSLSFHYAGEYIGKHVFAQVLYGCYLLRKRRFNIAR